MAASDVISFRPTAEERKAIDRLQKSLGLKTRAEAVRMLLQRGIQGERAALERLLAHRVPPAQRRRRTMTSREIDDFLYGRRP